MSLPITRLCLPCAQFRSFCQNTRFRNPELAAKVIERILVSNRGDDRYVSPRAKSRSRVAQSPADGVPMKKIFSPSDKVLTPSCIFSGEYAIQNLIKISKLIVDALNL